ncbi:MAG TPA: endoribonuclease MazF [Actinomycetota bacterium]|nr:endoribonuclease MazF [Actinomycetota bacterium]
MVVAEYVPDRGEIVWLHFNPQAGHEQAGRRPALTLSPRSYNRKVGLALFCPITSNVKGYPFEVELPRGLKAEGAVLCDQIKSLDWRVRRAERLCPAPAEVLEEATAKILVLVDPG